ncbi:hypothetical protein OIU84_011461 [Salix udensis]|uniref:Uncharacterized protein n=1 Tax=Salix udensis TaxID=889485 RepID=A0AAD6JPF2_9ROSI|nr:hypothetical protein OIU84_011461 [Salix udensis]
MCVKDAEQEMENPVDNNSDSNNNTNKMQSWPLHCDLLQTPMENFDQDSSLISSSGGISVANSHPLESICEDRVVTERKQNLLTDFFPQPSLRRMV